MSSFQVVIFRLLLDSITKKWNREWYNVGTADWEKYANNATKFASISQANCVIGNLFCGAIDADTAYGLEFI